MPEDHPNNYGSDTKGDTQEYTSEMKKARGSGLGFRAENNEPSGAERLGDPNVSGESSALINPKSNEGHGKDYSSGEENPSQGKDSTSDRSKLDDTDDDEPTEEFPKK